MSLEKQKIYGIHAGLLTDAEVDVSFFGKITKKHDGDDCSSEESDKPMDGERLSDILLVERDATWYALWKALTTLCALTSSYMYAHFSLVGPPSKGSIASYYQLGCEIVFALSVAFKFRLTFLVDGETRATRDPAAIARRYAQTDLAFDLLPLIPFERLLNLGGAERHLYFIKVVRLYNCSRVVNAKTVLAAIRGAQERRVQRQIDNDERNADCIDKDLTKATTIQITGYCLGVFQQLFVLMNCCLLLGYVWLMFCELQGDLRSALGIFEPPKVGTHRPLDTLNDDSFNKYFELESMSGLH